MTQPSGAPDDPVAGSRTFAAPPRGPCERCCALPVHHQFYALERDALAEISDLVEVSFKGRRTAFFRNPGRLDLHVADQVVVEADRGVDVGRVYMLGALARRRLSVSGAYVPSDLPAVVRFGTPSDLQSVADLRTEEPTAVEIAAAHALALSLPMTFEDAEWQFDRNRITLYFTADRRIDFRALVRRLAREFRTRVELRQIGARDQSGMVGGIGVCGRELCCATFLREFAPVSTSAAKCQDLPLNPARISGQCGKLKCCLNYEVEWYIAGPRGTPR